MNVPENTTLEFAMSRWDAKCFLSSISFHDGIWKAEKPLDAQSMHDLCARSWYREEEGVAWGRWNGLYFQ